MFYLLFVCVVGVSADPPKGYVCGRASSPIVIDGKLDDKDWADASWTDEFVDIEGDKKPKPRFKTRAKMLWDDNYFYIAAQMDEPHVWGTLTKHDSVIFHDPDFEVFIDPDGDNHQYYEFEMNALNTGWDLRLPKAYKDGGPALNEWEIPGLKTGVHIEGTINDPTDTDKGWSIEIAFPWKALAEFTKVKSPPGDGDQWRVNFSRVEWQINRANGKYQKVPNTKEDNWVWSPQGVVDMHRPETWGYVQFTQGKASETSFKPDLAWPAKDWLHAAYYAQRAHIGKTKSFAKTLEELGFPLKEGLSDPKILVSEKGFEVEVTITPKTADPQTWRIEGDSRLTRVK